MIVISLLEREASRLRAAILSAPQKAGAVEVRLDALPRVDPRMLSMLFEGAPRPIIATCRRRADGGLFAGSEKRRCEILRAAAIAGAGWVDVEHGSEAEDLIPALRGGHGTQIILSHHDTRKMPRDLSALYRRMAAVGEVAVVKIVGTARKASDVLLVKEFLGNVARATPRAASFCMGPAGVVSRILAVEWGSWATYASTGPGLETAPGQIDLSDLVGVYRIEELDEDTRFAAIIGSPVGHSLSPAMHNAAYRAHGLNYRYVPMEIPTAAGLADLPRLARDLRIRGFSVTTPWKVSVVKQMDLIEPLAQAVGAINTIVHDGRRLVGFNTDATGGIEALRERLADLGRDLKGLVVAIVGSGGAARALAFAVSGAGARVIVASRSDRPGRLLARGVGGAHVALSKLPREDYDVLVNCTPVGMGAPPREGRRAPLPVPRAAIKGLLVYDVVYTPQRTPLLREAEARGIATLGGLEMLVRQAAEQYSLFTGRTAPADRMREAALQALRGREESR